MSNLTLEQVKNLPKFNKIDFQNIFVKECVAAAKTIKMFTPDTVYDINEKYNVCWFMANTMERETCIAITDCVIEENDKEFKNKMNLFPLTKEYLATHSYERGMCSVGISMWILDPMEDYVDEYWNVDARWPLEEDKTVNQIIMRYSTDFPDADWYKELQKKAEEAKV
jgi:hypothetical protein